MGLLDSIATRLGFTKAVPGVTKSNLSQLLGTNRQTNFTALQNQKQQMAAYTDWVYGATQAIAEDVASIDFKLYVNRTSTKNLALVGRSVLAPREFAKLKARRVKVQTKNNFGNLVTKDAPALEEIENHPLLDLLHAPNPFMTKDEFFELTIQHMELAGECFWAIIRNKLGAPAELWPLMPYLVKVIPDSKKFVAGYTYLVPAGGELFLDAKDVIHHKYSNPNNFYRGMSVVAAAARSIDTDDHAADYNRKFFYNGAIPDATLETDTNLDDQAFKRLKDEWGATYGGTSNAHKVALLEAGLKFKMTSLSQKDMDFLASRNFSRDQILALFRVSKSILGLIEDSNRANMEAADYNHAKRVIRPKMIRLANRITEDLAPQFDVKLVVGFVDPVPEDKEFILKEKTAAVDLWWTKNEVRELEGKDPVPDGDSLFVSTTLIPLDQALMSLEDKTAATAAANPQPDAEQAEKPEASKEAEKAVAVGVVKKPSTHLKKNVTHSEAPKSKPAAA